MAAAPLKAGHCMLDHMDMCIIKIGLQYMKAGRHHSLKLQLTSPGACILATWRLGPAPELANIHSWQLHANLSSHLCLTGA